MYSSHLIIIHIIFPRRTERLEHLRCEIWRKQFVPLFLRNFNFQIYLSISIQRISLPFPTRSHTPLVISEDGNFRWPATTFSPLSLPFSRQRRFVRDLPTCSRVPETLSRTWLLESKDKSRGNDTSLDEDTINVRAHILGGEKWVYLGSNRMNYRISSARWRVTYAAFNSNCRTS